MRGTLGSLLQFFLCLGFCVSYCVGPFTSFSTLTFVSACMPLLCVLFFAWIPESPYYLINKGRKQEAYNALEWFRGYPDKSVVQSEIADIQVNNNDIYVLLILFIIIIIIFIIIHPIIHQLVIIIILDTPHISFHDKINRSYRRKIDKLKFSCRSKSASIQFVFQTWHLHLSVDPVVIKE